MGGHDLPQCVQVLLCARERAGSPQAKEEMRSTSMVAIISKVNGEQTKKPVQRPIFGLPAALASLEMSHT